MSAPVRFSPALTKVALLWLDADNPDDADAPLKAYLAAYIDSQAREIEALRETLECKDDGNDVLALNGMEWANRIRDEREGT